MSDTAYVVATLRHDSDWHTTFAGVGVFSEPTPSMVLRGTRFVVFSEQGADFMEACDRVYQRIRDNPHAYGWLAQLLPENGGRP